jgi:sugar lactone lactonase YvrE
MAGGAFFWWWTLQHREPELQPGWDARVIVIAGEGVTGTRGGAASHARFDDPFGVAVGANGTIFVGDGTAMPRVRAISPDGRVFDVAGGEPGFKDGPAATARFATISGLALDAGGILYVADTGNNAIRRITPDGQVSTIAGDGVAGCRDGPAAQARFNGPVGVAVDSAGRVIVADTYNDRIRRIDPDGTVTTVAGSDAVGPNGEAAVPVFDTPSGVAVDGAGRIYVADTGAGAVHALEPTGKITSLQLPYTNGPLRPVGVAANREGDVYVADERGRIVEIASSGQSRVVAGGAPGFADGAGPDARFRRPSGIAAPAPGRLIVADTGNALIRLVAANSQLELRPPPPPGIAPRFDAEAFSAQPLLWPVEPMAGPHEIAGTMGEARGSDAERLHTGVDVRVDEGTPVLAVRPGVVSSPMSTGEFGTLNEWLRVGEVSYVHLRAGRDEGNVPLDPGRFVPAYDQTGKLAGMRVKRGARFATGEMIGSVNRFYHVHMNVGWPGEEYNPLDFRLLHFTDTIPPTIARGGIMLIDQAGARLVRRARRRLAVSGPVQIVVDAWDQADGNRPSRRLAPYALGYQVLLKDGSPVEGFEHPLETIRFNQLALDSDARLIYARGSGIPFYGRRATRFLFTVTNTFRDGVASVGWWDTGRLVPGDYTVRVHAADRQGNSTTRDLPVTIEPAADQGAR